MLAGLQATSARAETGFELSLASDDRFRGESISGERPVATALISYDDVRGPYAGASATVVAARRDGVELLRSVQYLGYARAVGRLTFDIGVTNRLYAGGYTGHYGDRLTEFYVGVIGRRVQSHVYVTPQYDGYGAAVYGEVNALLLQRGPWTAAGHAGLLLPPDLYGYAQPVAFDWRVGAARSFGRLGLGVDWAGTSRDQTAHRTRGGIIISVRRSF